MNACAGNPKDEFLSVIEDIYNQDHYLIASCKKFPNRYSAEIFALDMSLRTFFEENNKITVAGKCLKYCDRDGQRRKIKIADISDQVSTPDITIINNYLADDTWDKIEW